MFSVYPCVVILALGIESILDAPIRFGGTTIGIICLEHIGKFRRWSSAEIT